MSGSPRGARRVWAARVAADARPRPLAETPPIPAHIGELAARAAHAAQESAREAARAAHVASLAKVAERAVELASLRRDPDRSAAADDLADAARRARSTSLDLARSGAAAAAAAGVARGHADLARIAAEFDLPGRERTSARDRPPPTDSASRRG